MQGAEFVNDLRCNYLTLPYEGEETEFSLRMIVENRTEGFLSVELRRLDGQTFLYYNISGRQSMEILYAEKTIDQETFRAFMWHLQEAIALSRELFLPGDGICLEPAAIFWNLGNQRWEFVYIPGRNDRERADIQKEREKFAEFLVMRINYEDKKLTETVYRFYEEICAGRMHTELFLEKENAECKEEWEMQREQERREQIAIADWEKKEEDENEENEEENVLKGEAKAGNKKLYKLLLLLWCAAFAITFLLGRTRQGLILPGGAAVVILTAVLLSIQIRQKRIRHKENTEETDVAYMEAEHLPYRIEREKIEKTGTEEKTVYVDIRQEQERKLYGIGKFRQQKIFLERLPCTVGKDAALADHIISDASVSRMHARFLAEGEVLWMQDLNSTNGTYHNGLRLKPNEKVMLEAEDEIGFGRAQFVFR